MHRPCDESFDYLRCKGCRIAFLADRPSDDRLLELYPAEYAPYQPSEGTTGPFAGPSTNGPRSARPRRALKKLARRANRRLATLLPSPSIAFLERAYRLPREGARLLDYGAGSPQFLNRARAHGWRTTGVDLSPLAVESIARAGHQALLASPELWSRLDDSSFRLVRLNHVLEHLPDPRRVVRQLLSKLEPGGILHLGLPNPDGLSSRLFGSRWFGLDCPRHLVLLGPSEALRLVLDEGYVAGSWAPEVVAKDLVRSLGYTFEDAFGMSRRRTSRWLESVLPEIAWLPVRLASALGLPDRFHLIARKPDEAPSSGGPQRVDSSVDQE